MNIKSAVLSPSGIAVCPEADPAAVARAANGTSFATCPAHRLAVAVARHLQYPMTLDPAVQHGTADGTRLIQDIGPVLRRIQDPRTPAGAPVVIHTQEAYQIYNCLKTMPNCIRSRDTTRAPTARCRAGSPRRSRGSSWAASSSPGTATI